MYKNYFYKYSRKITVELETGDLAEFNSFREKKEGKRRKSDHPTVMYGKRRHAPPSEIQKVFSKGSCKLVQSSRGGKKLVDPKGFTYNVKAVNKNISVTYWQCSIRPKINPCRASLIEKSDGSFLVGRHQHNHQVNPASGVASRVLQQVKSKAATDVYKSAQVIVREVVLGEINSDVEINRFNEDEQLPVAEGYIPSLKSLIRSANRFRKSLRPLEPTDISFTLDPKYIPEDFYKCDVVLGEGNRHLIFATNNQLTALSHAETWFADITPATCKQVPFKQIFTLSGYVGKALPDNNLTNIRLVPLVFVLMTSTSKNNGLATKEQQTAWLSIIDFIIKLIKQRIPTPRVRNISTVNDKELIKTFNNYIPTAKVRIDPYYYQKALVKKAIQLGMLNNSSHPNVSLIAARCAENIKSYMCLPLIPSYEVLNSFRMLQNKETHSQMHAFTKHVYRSWICSKTVQIEDWNCYNEVYRHHTEVNKWRLKIMDYRKHESHVTTSKSQRNSWPFYLLIQTLHLETKSIAESCLVDDLRLKSRPQPHFSTESCWEKFESMGEQRSSQDLLCELTGMMEDEILLGQINW